MRDLEGQPGQGRPQPCDVTEAQRSGWLRDLRQRIRKWNWARLARRHARRDLPQLLEALGANDASMLEALIYLVRSKGAGSGERPAPAAAMVDASARAPSPASARSPVEEINARIDALTAEILKRVLRADSTCIDVGCHVGDELRAMMQHAPRGKFYAFEPLPHLYQHLLASFPSDQVKLFDIALSDRTGTSTFNYVISNPGYSGFLRRRYDRPQEEDTQITVRTDLLDRIVDPTDTIDFIKIDVEGAELQVLRGAIRTIRRCKPVIVFEHGLGAADYYGTQPESVFDLICDCGMAVALLEGWLEGRAPLSRGEFCEQFRTGKSFYFVAHPIESRSRPAA